MSDVSPSDMLTYELGGRMEEVFFQTVNEVPAVIKATYAITSADATPIDFYIISPLGVELYSEG